MTDVSLTTRYRKKPVEVDAVQWNGSAGWAEVIIDWITENGGAARLADETTPFFLAIDTLEGTMTALEGDYIIRGIKGEFYPCKPDIFEASYDRA